MPITLEQQIDAFFRARETNHAGSLNGYQKPQSPRIELTRKDGRNREVTLTVVPTELKDLTQETRPGGVQEVVADASALKVEWTRPGHCLECRIFGCSKPVRMVSGKDVIFVPSQGRGRQRIEDQVLDPWLLVDSRKEALDILKNAGIRPRSA